ncbi:HD family phosphohydrolase [Haloimpatiens lingqiaonensis]|uniref:HD family phosphohydrolase n=1 Tax=Haloimpatiens lingqiaonensis TaxID=1380675 RepID=UPI0010FD9963|nr:HD family phosphohydrolase [Haloimpatiens lingqiaonensis]
MKKHDIKKIFNKRKYRRNIIFLLAFIFIYSVMATSLVTKKYNIKEGEIAKVDIKATRDVKDEVSTKALIDQAVKNSGPQYSVDKSVKENVIKNINELFRKVIEVQESAKNLTENDKNNLYKQKIEELKNATAIKLSTENMEKLIKLNEAEVRSLNTTLRDIMTEVYDNKIMEDKKEDVKEARETIVFRINSSDLSKVAKEIGSTIGYMEIFPNYVFDEKKTQEYKDKVIKEVQPIIIKKDQIIVKEGEPVEKYQLDILKSLGLLDNKSYFEWYLYISLAGVVLIVMALQLYYLRKYHSKVYNDNSKLILIFILIFISLSLARVLGIISPFLVPLSCVPMLMTLLIGQRVALTINVINCALIGAVVGFKPEIIMLSVINGVIGTIILKKMQQRNDILYSSIYMAIINVLFTFSSGFLLSNNVLDVAKNAAFAFVASCISGVLTIGFLPFFESTFDIVTTIKLLELSNPNNPLLRKILLEAPGTYHHSVLVGNLAEVAAEAVGGNPVLARVGAYYHDAGKIKRPYFFKENQLGGENPHNKITPNLSTLIITSHVKDGLELAKEYKIPKEIQNIIMQHHGTSLVKYFYLTVKNASEDPESVKEEDFRYPGPIPNSKEAAIIMLADGVEAAVRSISNPTKGKIEEMVNNIIKGRLSEGQLDDCDLTLKDLNKIRKSFLKVLSGIYHQRIEYPSDKWAEKVIEEEK